MQESERIFIAENATLLRGSERELNRQLFTILNSIYDGLYITDGQANTILINRAYEEVSGLRREDVLGKSMQEIVATGMIDRSGSLGVLKTRKPVTLEQTFRTGDEIQPSELPIACRFEGESHGGDETGRVNLKLEVARFEYEYICRAYEKYGTVRAAAASLGMDSATFVRKRRKFEELLQK